MFKLLSLTVLALYTSAAAGGQVGGYHYEKPSVSLGLFSSGPSSGHSFGPLPTIAPLPPVPALPPLPTARSNGQVRTQSIFQTHPVAINAINSIQSNYLPPSGAGIGKIAQQYQSPRAYNPSSAAAPAPSPPAPFSFPSTLGSGIGSNLQNPSPAPPQPLRVPFGKQAIISYPTTGSAEQSSYESNGRALKQYAVIEIIDNDIEQSSQPFLTTPFFDSYRAHIGASGTGASAPAPASGGVQLQSRSNALVQEQQRLSAQSSSSGDAVALGSGGLGFIRLPNGNVYLGSGSLGYISGQQHTQSLNEARTRSGAPQPDALHFGHGPLGGQRSNRFFYRFK